MEKVMVPWGFPSRVREGLFPTYLYSSTEIKEGKYCLILFSVIFLFVFFWLSFCWSFVWRGTAESKLDEWTNKGSLYHIFFTAVLFANWPICPSFILDHLTWPELQVCRGTRPCLRRNCYEQDFRDLLSNSMWLLRSVCCWVEQLPLAGELGDNGLQ